MNDEQEVYIAIDESSGEILVTSVYGGAETTEVYSVFAGMWDRPPMLEAI